MIYNNNIYKFENLNIPHEFIVKPHNFIHNLDNLNINKFNKISLLTQNHTDIIKKVTNENYMNNDIADAQITDVEGISLGIKVADCQAIFLYDETKKVIANVHSGWKGTIQKIIKKTIDIMVNDYNCNINNIKVWFNPSILNCHFEVDEDVYTLFKNNFNEFDISKFIDYKKNKYYIDSVGINVELLKHIGISSKNITNSKICSFCNNDIHSYRREKNMAGRNLAIITLKKN